MKHTFSADASLFESVDSTVEHLSEGCTRNQTIQLRQAVELYWQYVS